MKVKLLDTKTRTRMESCSRELEEIWNFPNYIGAIAGWWSILLFGFIKRIYQKIQLAFQTQDMLNLVESYHIPELESWFIVRS